MYKILEIELLLCKRCEDKYSEDNKPCILSCGNTVCSTCASQLTKVYKTDSASSSKAKNISHKCFFESNHTHAGEIPPVNFSFLDIVTALNVSLESKKHIKEDDIVQSYIHNSLIASNLKKSAIVFNGKLLNGKKQGQGELITTSYIFQGNYQNDVPFGPGKLYYKVKGVVFEGTFTGEYGNGKGIIRYSNGDVYTGEWKNFKKIGKGTFELSNGNKYDGAFDNDKYNGYGEYFNIEENKWMKGNWKEGKENGDFLVYTSKETKPLRARYKLGLLEIIYDNDNKNL